MGGPGSGPQGGGRGRGRRPRKGYVRLATGKSVRGRRLKSGHILTNPRLPRKGTKARAKALKKARQKRKYGYL